ncbi:hypothetical protein D3C87_1826780 [compost metagenome]
MRILAELRGSSASLRLALKRSSMGVSWFLIVAFSAARFSAYCWARAARFLFFSMELVFAMS